MRAMTPEARRILLRQMNEAKAAAAAEAEDSQPPMGWRSPRQAEALQRPSGAWIPAPTRACRPGRRPAQLGLVAGASSRLSAPALGLRTQAPARDLPAPSRHRLVSDLPA
jgi:hypothetical protein